MKALSYITAIFAFILISIYILLFTSIGNPVIAPYINDKLSQTLNLPTKIENFRLNTSKINLAVNIDGKNKVIINGEYSLFDGDFNINYDLSLNDISSFSKLAKMQLQGSLNTKGNIKGDQKKILIKGESNLASSDTGYEISLLRDGQLENILLVMKDADIGKLLYMIKQKQVINGKLNINTDISSFDMKNLLGNINGYVSNGMFNTSLIKKDFKLDIPETKFICKFDTVLNKDIDYKLNFDSSLAKIDSKGNIKPDTQFINSDFKLFISKLQLLESAIGMKLKGELALNGKIKGDKDNADLSIISNIASSDTKIDLNLVKFKPNSLKGDIKKLNLPKILYMLNQPAYFQKGDIDMQLNIKSLAQNNLKGDIKTNINKAVLNNKTIKKLYEQKLPANTKISSNLQTKLDKNLAITKGKVNSSIANLIIDDLTYNIKNSSLDTKAVVDLYNLSKLEPILERKLRGDAKITISSKIDKDFTAKAVSNILSGTLNTNTVNEKSDIDIKNISVKDALYMLYYPHIYSGNANGKINVDTKKETAKFNIDLKNGHFEQNELTLLLANALKLDLTNENFSYAVVKGTKKKQIINADLTMESQNLNISTKRCMINTKKQLINAVLAFKYRHYDFDVVIKGDLKNPKVSSKIAQTILKEKAKSALEKKMGDKLDENMKGLLQNLLKF